MFTINNKQQLSLLLTSAIFLIPKIARSEITANLIDNSEDDGTQQPSPKETDIQNQSQTSDSASISQPESINPAPELTRASAKNNYIEEELLQVQENLSKKICVLTSIAKPESININNLEAKNHSVTAINSDKLEQSNYPKLEPKNPHNYCQDDDDIEPKSTVQKQPEQIADTREVNREVIKKEEQENSKEDSKYIIPPKIADDKQINTLTTTLPLNGANINHLTDTNFAIGSNFGEGIDTSFDYAGLVKLYSQVKESLTKDNIFTVEQRGSYVQIQAVRKKNEVTFTTKEPRTLLGTEIQLSLTGSCIFPGSNPNDQCTYTPGLVTDRDSIDPDTLLPRRILQTSNIGDVVTPESLAAMQLPGFQRGANGQNVGVDLFFPNSGSYFGNTQSNQSSISRNEKTENTPAGFYSTVRQIVRANDKEAVIGRTVRGFGFIVDDKNTVVNSALQLSGLILPDIDPKIAGSENPVNPSINKNLFFAANNTRLPANSFTFYHGGSGRAETPQPGSNLNQLAPGFFDSVWVGVSPVTTRSLSSRERFEITSERRVRTSAGAEGGFNSNTSLLSIVNDQIFSSSNLREFYNQIYLALFNQDVNYLNTTKFTEETNYYPHLSFSGNRTGNNDVWRYYGGVIIGEELNAYIGTDYTKNTLDGWNYSIEGIFYTNPDADYYSQIKGNVSKRFDLSRNSNLVLSSGINYAIDRKYEVGGTIFNSPASSVSLGGRMNMGAISFGLNNYFGGILPNSIANTLLADLSVKFGDNFTLSAYYTPINESSSRSRYGIQGQYKFGNNDSSSLFISWANNEYDFGIDAGGNKLETSNNVFRVMFKSSF